MCLIIASQTGKMLDKAEIMQGYKDNPHSWGIAVARNGRLEISKGFSEQNLERAVDNIDGNPYVIHYRWATSGLFDLNNGHPFNLSDELCFAHNGIIGIPRPNKNMSDTWHFAELLKALGTNGRDLSDRLYIRHLEEEIGTGNKLAFLSKYGKLTIVNETEGRWRNHEVWISNIYSTPGYHQFEAWWRYLGLSKEAGPWLSFKKQQPCSVCNKRRFNLMHAMGEVLVCSVCHGHLTREESAAAAS